MVGTLSIYPEFHALTRQLIRDPFFSAFEFDDRSISQLRQPVIDIKEKEDAFYVDAELPGLSKENLSLEVKDGHTLVLGGHVEKVSKEEDDKHTMWRQERSISDFHRTIRFPMNLDPENIQAELKNGVLHIHIPKCHQETQKKIKIK